VAIGPVRVKVPAYLWSGLTVGVGDGTSEALLDPGVELVPDVPSPTTEAALVPDGEALLPLHDTTKNAPARMTRTSPIVPLRVIRGVLLRRPGGGG
jgi:hypothetical protein